MSESLLSSWLRHYDPIHRGWTPNGIANGVCVTNGWAFPRIRGGYNLRRSLSGPPGPGDLIVGAAPADAREVRTFAWVAHPQGNWCYRLSSIGGGGVEEPEVGSRASVEIGSANDWLGPRPNQVSDLRVEPSAGGRFLLSWTYCPAGQQTAPTAFGVYQSEPGEPLAWDSAVEAVPFRAGRLHYEYRSLPFAEGMVVAWGVRAASAAGEEGNTAEVRAAARATGPSRPPVVTVRLDGQEARP